MSFRENAMFIITDEDMRDFKWRDKYNDFDVLEDVETLAMQENWCMIRTWKLMPTLWFMQDAGRRIWSLEPDDEYISWVKLEKNILTYYKTKWQKQN